MDKITRGIFSWRDALDEHGEDKYCDLVCKFIHENETLQLNDIDKNVMRYVADVLSKQEQLVSNQGIFIKWYPAYRCALIAKLYQGCMSTKMRYLSLVGLDQWQFSLQGSSDSRDYTSLSEGYASICIAHMEDIYFETFLTCLGNAFNQAISKQSDSNKQNIKTPAFIEAVLNDANSLLQNEITGLSIACVNNALCGGWSDITDHTGGGWSLVTAVIEHLFSYAPPPINTMPKTLYELFSCHLELWLLEGQRTVSLPLLKERKPTHVEIVSVVDLLMKMLISVTRKAAYLAEKGHDITLLDSRCYKVRKDLDDAVICCAKEVSNTYLLQNFGEISWPSYYLTKHNESFNTNDLMNKMREAKRNLDCLPILLICDNTLPVLSKMLDWMNAIGKETHRELLLVITSVESVIFTLSKQLPGDGIFNIDIENLEKIVDEYRLRVNIFMKLLLQEEKGNNSMLKVEVKSKEVVIVWVAFCLIHKYIKKTIPIIDKYGVALQWKDLRHLVLSDEEALSASLAASEYVKKNSNSRPLFSLESQEFTFVMAENFTINSVEFQQIWQNEVNAANKREEEHWKIVTNKQTQVRDLKIKLDDKKFEKEKVEKELSENKLTLTNHNNDCDIEQRQIKREISELKYYMKWQKRDLKRKLKEKENELSNHNQRCNSSNSILQSKISSLSEKIRQIEYEIRNAKKPPDPVFQPLPQNALRANRVLFFLHIPVHIQILARFTIMSQQMLLPNTDKLKYTGLDENKLQSIRNTTEVPENHLKTSLQIYYNNHNPTKICPSMKVHIYSAEEPPQHVGPTDVTEFTKKGEGCWYPDTLSPLMFWSGGDFSLDNFPYFFNPFKCVESNDVVDSFTEKADEKSLQWIMPQYGEATCPSRGNLPIAHQNLKPVWLKKPQWLELANLRAFPNRQLRNLCRVLSDRSIPLNSSCVLTIIRLVLYHTGDISEDGRPQWKTDQFFGDFGGIMQQELEGIADEISNKPRDYSSMFLLIEIASYCIQYFPSFQNVCRTFERILLKWVDSLDQQMTNADREIVINLRAKKALLCKYALLCYARGNITRDDAQEMCKLIILSHYEIITQGQTALDDEIKSLTIVCQKVISSRMGAILKEVKADNYAMLTAAVQSLIHNTPNYLCWEEVKDNENDFVYFSNACFQAISENCKLYSINLSNGILLVDGQPISRLPACVYTHPLYKRTFKDRSFEICLSNGVYTTVKPTKGCIYTFELRGNHLFVHEVDKETKTDLQLLENDGLWGTELPVRLRELHSHWYCDEKNAVLIRDIGYCERSTDFVIKKENDNEPWICFRVPLHRRQYIWNEFINNKLDLSQLDKLIFCNDVRKMLEKFEDVQYIQTYISPSGTIKVEFPRFKLQFELKSSGISSPYFESLDYAGYRLASCQQLDDTLLGFCRYLVIEEIRHRPEDTKVIIPVGDVQINNGFVEIVGCNKSDSQWNVFSYNIHSRMRNLQATNISARLLLAELYTATSSLLPETRMKMTGEEVAMKLLRQSWGNQPLNQSDYARLQNISKLCHCIPGLSILSFEVGKSSLQTAFLHSITSEPVIEFPTHDSNLYLHEVYPWNVKSTLTSDEEHRVFGRGRAENVTTPVLLPNKNKSIPNCEVEGIGISEESLKEFLLKKTKERTEFFLGHDTKQKKLQFTMMEELQHSFQAYNEIPDVTTETNITIMYTKIRCLLKNISENRISVETYLQRNITEITSDSSQANAFRIMRIANISPMLQLEDILKAACSTKYLKTFNPFLSEEDVNTLHAEILKWMQLCVLEDKLNRLCALCQTIKCDDKGRSNSQQIIKELCVRTWPVEEHPEWLVFEVFAQLQIRPLQYYVANSIIKGIGNNTGPIIQLNMGEGKTRVILPMLILHWRKSEKLIRLNFLSSLIQEAFNYLQQNLCSSVIDCKLFHLPFSRDVHVNEEQAMIMYNSLKFCQSTRGVLFVTPQHRLSLKLKWYELYENGKMHANTCKVLEEIENISYVDLLDESDEILRMKCKLIYACGSHEHLISGEIRWHVLQALLQIIKENSAIHDLLSRSGVAQWKQGSNDSAEAFKEFRIIDGNVFQSIKERFYEVLLDTLINNPPHTLRWAVALKENYTWVVNYIINPAADIGMPNLEGNKQMNDLILSLRGYLANGLLIHCLMKRNRVEYGVKHGEKKRMAVPFHACETPAPRAEFGHPDCAIIYTLLAYYYDGLSREQILEAFRTLLSLGATAQDSIYKEWYKLSKPSTKKGSCEEILNSVIKVDLSNEIMVSLLVEYYQYNIGTINFWLETNVFPIETQQYPNRLEATSWDIATNINNEVAGFSGTNDDKLLLPSTLYWVKPKKIALKATDGKMLQLIATNATFHVLTDPSDDTSGNNESQWKKILDMVIKMSQENTYRTCALIDAGALMAGSPNTENVAVYLADHLDATIYQGVVYFDTNGSGWRVIDHLGRSWLKHSSPIHERDAFVYFDESRCRGADMKLLTNSRAVLTLGPNMCKDKLMQAAGRMRQLEQGQKVVMIALDDVTAKICDFNSVGNPMEITPVHVLKWVLHNTFASISKWLPEWAIQGGRYVIKQGKPKFALIPDMLHLSEMYGHKLTEEFVNHVWQQWRSSLMKRRLENKLPPNAHKILKNIDERILEYGSDYRTVFTIFEEECERELEKEVEVEEEVEKQVLSKIPRFEEDWNVHFLLSCTSVTSLNTNAGLNMQSLASFIEDNIYYEMKSIKANGIQLFWPPGIYGTENFFFACQQQFGYKSLNDYLRLVNSFLIFPSGEILLISERESDKILELSWDKQMNCFLVNLTYVRQYHETKTVKFQSPKSNTFDVTILENCIAALQLFHGDVIYETEDRRDAIKEILADVSAKSMASRFSTIRGLTQNYSRSHLEDICSGFK